MGFNAKTKLVLWYAVAVLLSHLFQSYFHESPQGIDGVGREGVESPRLAVVFEGAGDESDTVNRIATELREREACSVVKIRFGTDSLEQLDELLSNSEEEKFRDLYVVGVGYGAVRALEFTSIWKRNVKRVLLVEPVVSTRFELLGDEALNSALKAFQFAWFWILDNATPHFGSLDLLPYNYRTASALYEADLGHAADLYEKLDTVIILAGRNDSQFWRYGLGPLSAVKPEARIITWERVDEVSISELVKSLVGKGKSPSVAEDKVMAQLSLSDFPSAKLGDAWAGTLLGIATFASEDFACIGGGLLAASGSVSLWVAILGCLLGIFLGDFGIYLMGRIFGLAALDIPVIRSLVSAKALQRGSDWFEERGLMLVVITRFFPGSRVPTYFAAGVVGVGWIRFAFALLVASTIWTPILVVASYYFGDDFLAFFESMGVGGWLGVVAAIVCFAIGTRVLAKLITWKGRRLLYSSWRRLRAFEFWPIWAVYFPVVFKIVGLAIRYRSVSLPFSVNPCMPASGLVYESKIQILDHLQKYGAPVARFESIDLDLAIEEKMERLARFMDREGLEFPIVLKPDVGQRGQGVSIVHSTEEARRFFKEQEENSIAQEYIAGKEYGVFYYRFAGEETGVVSSITDKRVTYVVGDGVSNLEKLILADGRAVCMARFFLECYETQLDRILGKGERFALASIGTHSRGAVFLDGASLITPELTAAVDAFSRNVEGFHFGRYDLKVPNEEALKRGEGIRVIELNGITSEPTNMYDPKHGALFGWRSLMRQWELIFALAKENRLAGHEPVSKKYVLKLAIGYWRGVPSRSLS